MRAFTFVTVTLSAFALVRASPQQTEPETVISWQEAKNHVGKMVTVEGRVVNTRRIEGGIVLDFHADFASNFRVIIPGSVATKFPSDPMIRFNKRNVQATGKIQSDRGIPFLRVTDPKSIKTVPVKRQTS